MARGIAGDGGGSFVSSSHESPGEPATSFKDPSTEEQAAGPKSIEGRGGGTCRSAARYK